MPVWAVCAGGARFSAAPRLRLQCFIGEVQFRATQTAAGAAGVTLHSLPIQSPDDFQAAFDRAARERTIHGVVVLSSPLILEQRSQIAEWALKARLPTISLFTLFPGSGGLMAYGPNLPDMYKHAAVYVDRILTGTKVADLPIERPTKFELIINLKTAKALGLTVPPTLLARAASGHAAAPPTSVMKSRRFIRSPRRRARAASAQTQDQSLWRS